MPIFEYKCGVCGHQFERLVLAGELCDSNHRRCPECKGRAEKIISSSNLRFWGPGWDKPNSKKGW